MTIFTFDEQGSVNNVLDFGVYNKLNFMAAGLEISSNTWHTVLAHESGSVCWRLKKVHSIQALLKILRYGRLLKARH